MSCLVELVTVLGICLPERCNLAKVPIVLPEARWKPATTPDLSRSRVSVLRLVPFVGGTVIILVGGGLEIGINQLFRADQLPLGKAIVED